MKDRPDINDTLREEGPDAVRARHDEAWRRRRGPKGVNGKEPPGDGITEGKKTKAGNGHDQLAPCTIEETLAVFTRWLILRDLNPVYAVLGTVAANLLPGDPVWLGLVAPPSSAKTEILNSVSLLPGIVQAATLTPAGLLSGTPKKQCDKGAKGGLLRQLGDFGIIVLKDFGSVLSMRFDARAEILAALREIFDGAWIRHLGTDGGKTLEWRGKAGLLFGVTGAIDSHYAVIGAMGDRFLLTRQAPVGEGQFNRALQHAGTANGKMRTELGQAVARLFAGRQDKHRAINADEIKRLDDVISLVVRLRGAVERDRHSREIEAVYGAEGTARIGLMLERLLAGLDTLGVERTTAFKVVTAIAMDSVPPLRRRAYEHLHRSRDVTGNFIEVKTSDIAEALGLPTTTVRRALEDLAAYGVVARKKHGQGNADEWVLL
jgi:CRP-like cAMP-binding protein